MVNNSKTVYFSTSAQLARRLGRESVSDPVVAVLELIKNSYDADATISKIVFEKIKLESGSCIKITDDGSGMSEEDIIKKWLRAATNNKKVDKITKKYKRRKIGEKGIGRFATERLAKRITLTSKPENNIKGYLLEINWKQFDDPNADFDKIPLKLEFFDKSKSEHGFEIVLEELSEKWTEKEVERLKRDISLVMPPNIRESKFSVKIVAEEFPKFEGKIKSNFLKDADFIFNGELQNNGKIVYEIKTRYGKVIRKEEKYGNFLCGPIEFRLFFYYLGPSEFFSKRDKDKIDFETRRKIMENFCGIKLYRDGFRIKPFGDLGNDWLDLNKDRVNNPGLYPGNKQMFGIVKIGKDSNPNIEDTTSRENIVTNMAWNDLKNFIRGSIGYFVRERQKLEGKFKGQHKVPSAGGKKDKDLIKESFQKAAEAEKRELIFDEQRIQPIPQAIIESCPKSMKSILDEFNGCLSSGYYNATAILARKILETGTILKFKIEKKESLIAKAEELNQRIEILKQQNMLDKQLSKNLVSDNKIKLFGDTAAHSYRIDIRKEDIGPIRDLLRLCLEQLFGNNN